MGGIAMYTIVNLMASHTTLDLSRTFSVLGYGLLPVVVLSAIAVVVDLKGVVGSILGLTSVLWSTLAAARIFEAAMTLHNQKWLVAFPSALLYGIFVLLTVF